MAIHTLRRVTTGPDGAATVTVPPSGLVALSTQQIFAPG
jgi:hypothetical protein